MKLTNVRVNEFQSIRDSNEFEVGDITCLVGKNEAGKTAVLKALYRLNPIVKPHGVYDVTDDYPRLDVEDYKHDVETKKRDPATVVTATFKLEDTDLEDIYSDFGDECITKPEMVITKGYNHKADEYSFTIYTNIQKALEHLFSTANLDTDTNSKLAGCTTVDAAIEVLKDQEQTAEVARLSSLLSKVKARGLDGYIHDN
ncbi:MAG: AAA family ATPase, partial [Acidobacteriota bacterium]|nr:AAA family ATPase [Acidobacteriota bacterium]